MNKIAALLLLCGAASTYKKLFDQFNCNSCHMEKVGGDGSAIFTRPDRKVTNPQKLLEQVTICFGALGKKLTQQEQQHLGAYLNQNYYKFK